MKTVRYLLWALVLVAGAAFAFIWTGGNQPPTDEIKLVDKLGGPFELTRHDGNTVTEKDLTGRSHAIFFGFTHCPEICPTTLYEISGWLNELGDIKDNIDVYFITVDPERDTQEILATYINSFSNRVSALTGSPEQIQKVISGYKIFAEKIPLEDDDYTMDHTATILLFKPNGELLGTIGYGENSTTAIAKLKRLAQVGKS